MTITAEQREERRNYLGASDIPRLMRGEFYAVWLQKVMGATTEATEAMDLGTAFEEPILQRFEDTHHVTLARNVELAVPDSPIVVHLDGCDDRTGVPCEAKLVLNAHRARQWGEAGTDEVPDDVKWQVLTHMLATERECSDVAALITERLYVEYAVQRDDDAIAGLVQVSLAFWNDYVVPKVEPPVSETQIVRALPLLKSVPAVPEKVVDATDPDVLDWFEHWRRIEGMAAKCRSQWEAQARRQLGDATALRMPDGRTLRRKISTVKYKAKPASAGTREQLVWEDE